MAILDSCSSGAFTRTKGGRDGLSFLSDKSYNMKGNAFITSSSADEVSQESDKIHGSFFTHYFISGMRGAASNSQDKKITLNEVYQYTYRETLLRTENTSGGIQHANFNIEMAGTGDVVLTDLSKSTSILTIKEELSGVFLIKKKYEGVLFTEINKPYGRDINIGIENGDYSVSTRNEEGFFESSFHVEKGEIFSLSKKNFKKVNGEKTTNRGEATDKANFFSHPIDYIKNRTGINLNGYLSMAQSYSYTDKNVICFVGLNAIFIINERILAGFGAYGMASPPMENRSFIAGENFKGKKDSIQIGYGGTSFGYIHPISNNLFLSGSIFSGLASGNIAYDEKTSSGKNREKTKYLFIAKPQVDVWFPVFETCRIGLGASYLYMNGIDKKEINISKIDGFYGEITLALMIF